VASRVADRGIVACIIGILLSYCGKGSDSILARLREYRRAARACQRKSANLLGGSFSFRSPWLLLANPVDSCLREEDEHALPTLSVSSHD
jgi:hypothetical protein